MFYGVYGEHKKNKEAFQIKLDGVYHPLNDSIGWLTTCIEEMKQDIARIQQATEASRQTSIDRGQHASIDCRSPTSIYPRLPASIDISPPHSHPMQPPQNFHTKEEIDHYAREIGGDTKIHCPSTRSIRINRQTQQQIDQIYQQTSVDDATNRGRLVPKVKSDMSDTNYHGEETSADTYATLRRHQFKIESLEERLQRMENITATMKEKWRRGDEAMRDFTESIYYIYKIMSDLEISDYFGAFWRYLEQAPEMTIELDNRSILKRSNRSMLIVMSIDNEARRKPIWSQPPT
ncbi:hypothetical protein F2Q69_00023564 [Brassica cretica]|uniref:Uncharacterized protein n=1 Tax=Brassica cretica TaxID=69181 RepID=A0A8S9Q478_BRACR|nr:hypothetical protein F2Q69_00023564 [Brassica cretica]